MHLQTDKSNRMDELKTQFKAREGYYRLMNSPDYSQKSQRAMGFGNGTTNSNSSTINNEKTCIKISLVTINERSGKQDSQPSTSNNAERSQESTIERPRVYKKSRGVKDKKICFNVGRELFVYNYDGVRRGPDASNPIYKRSYKNSLPTCHDFNQTTATSQSISLIVGFSHGQVQLIDLHGRPDQEHVSFNIDRLIDKSRVTCLRWLPNSASLFLVAHASGQLYLYKDNLPSVNTPPIYQVYKQSEGVIVYTCKSKTVRNPIYKWTIGSLPNNQNPSLLHQETESCSLNEFTFSPCGKYLACVSQDGFLRVYCYDTMELIGRARSYYGGLSCVCWSPDGKYVVTGGEDDLITVWSFLEKRVVARGMGHKSWVSVVSFDPHFTGHDLRDSEFDREYDEEEDEDDDEDDNVDDDDNVDRDEDMVTINGDDDGDSRVRSIGSNDGEFKQDSSNRRSANQETEHCSYYRFGSVGQDTQLCLWDLNDDLINQPISKHKSVILSPISRSIETKANGLSSNATTKNTQPDVMIEQVVTTEIADGKLNEIDQNAKQKRASTLSNSKDSPSFSGGLLSSTSYSFSKTFTFSGKKDKKNTGVVKHSLDKSNKTYTNTSSASNKLEDPAKLLGSPICPKLNEVPLLEPTICKKISYERLTSLIFCRGGFITSCQDGFVFSWARPSRVSVVMFFSMYSSNIYTALLIP